MDVKNIKFLAQLSEVVKRNNKNPTNGTNICRNIKRGNILSYVDFSKICNVIKSFPELEQNIVK